MLHFFRIQRTAGVMAPLRLVIAAADVNSIARSKTLRLRICFLAPGPLPEIRDNNYVL